MSYEETGNSSGSFGSKPERAGIKVYLIRRVTT